MLKDSKMPLIIIKEFIELEVKDTKKSKKYKIKAILQQLIFCDLKEKRKISKDVAMIKLFTGY